MSATFSPSRKAFFDQFRKDYAKDKVEVIRGDAVQDILAIPTGLLSFDIASGVCGFPRGRIVEVFGPESGGKTLLTLLAAAYAQRHFDADVLYLDIEGSTPREWLSVLNVNLKKFDIIPAGLSAEQLFDAMIAAITTRAYTYIIADSVAAMISRAELEGNVDKNYMAELARAMSKGVKKVSTELASIPANEAPCVIFINQVREKPGVMFGDPETTPGGRALKFFAAQRYRVARKSQSEIKEDGEVIGHTVTVTNKKNKLGPPKRVGEFAIHYMKGADTAKTLKSLLKQRKLYSKKGQAYILTLGDESFTFATVDDMDNELSLNLAFQQKVYQFLLKTSKAEVEAFEADLEGGFDETEELDDETPEDEGGGN